MKILETRVYRGPNLYALWPMIRLHVDLGELEEYPTRKLPGFADRLLELVPTLAEHTCGLGVHEGFIRRMKEDEGTWLGHVLEHIAIELQCLAGTPVTFGKTRGEGLPTGQYHVVYSYVEEPVGIAAGRLALRLIRHLLPPEREAHDPSPFDARQELESFIRRAQRRVPGGEAPAGAVTADGVVDPVYRPGSRQSPRSGAPASPEPSPPAPLPRERGEKQRGSSFCSPLPWERGRG